MQWNSEQQIALKEMQAGRNIFLHGDAGTGKTTLINQFIMMNRAVVSCIAPTGRAALNMPHGGITIHRFCGLLGKMNNAKQILGKIKVIVIDEISMVRSDLLVELDRRLRHHAEKGRPFGGKQVIAVGDFHQLPPVVDKPELYHILMKRYGGLFAFETSAWKDAEFQNIELRTPHRQAEPKFLALLNAVRNRSSALPELLRQFNIHAWRQSPESPCLCYSRAIAASINHMKIKRLATPKMTYRGCFSGQYAEKDQPTDMVLMLKLDMFVILLANDPHGAYVNGDLGLIEDMDDEVVYVKLQRGGSVAVKRYTWLSYSYQEEEYEPGKWQLKQKITGSFQQYPIAPAYAITIHKSQGQTMDRVHLELGIRPCFAAGQLYVALSRACCLEGITTSRPLSVADVHVDERVRRFYQSIH